MRLTGQLPVAMEDEFDSGGGGSGIAIAGAGVSASKLLSATCEHCGIECPKPVRGNLK